MDFSNSFDTSIISSSINDGVKMSKGAVADYLGTDTLKDSIMSLGGDGIGIGNIAAEAVLSSGVDYAESFINNAIASKVNMLTAKIEGPLNAAIGKLSSKINSALQNSPLCQQIPTLSGFSLPNCVAIGFGFELKTPDILTKTLSDVQGNILGGIAGITSKLEGYQSMICSIQFPTASLGLLGSTSFSAGCIDTSGLLGEELGSKIEGGFDSITEMSSSLIGEGTAALDDFMSPVGSALDSVTSTVEGGLSSATSLVTNGINTATSTVGDLTASAVSTVTTAGSGIASTALSTVRDAGDAIAASITDSTSLNQHISTPKAKIAGASTSLQRFA